MKNFNSYTQLRRLLPKVTISDKDIEKIKKQQKDYVEQADSFTASLSINHYMIRPLNKFIQQEKLDLMQTLFDKGFFLTPYQFNNFYLDANTGLDIFRGILKAKGYDKKISIGKYLILETILSNRKTEEFLSDYYIYFEKDTSELLKKEYNQLTIGSLLEMFVLNDGTMSMGDEPFLESIIAANKALFARDFALENLKLLDKNYLEIYNIVTLL